MGSPGTDSETEFRMQGVTKERPGDQPLGKGWGGTKQEWQREVKVRCRSETSLHNPRGALDVEWLFIESPQVGDQTAGPLISHTVLSLNIHPTAARRMPDEPDRWSLSQLKLSALPGRGATSSLLKELLGSMSQRPSQARTEIKH